MPIRISPSDYRRLIGSSRPTRHRAPRGQAASSWPQGQLCRYCAELIRRGESFGTNGEDYYHLACLWKAYPETYHRNVRPPGPDESNTQEVNNDQTENG